MRINTRLIFMLLAIALFASVLTSIPFARAEESSISLKGFILSNTYYNDSGVNNTDIPALATTSPKGSFGGTARQSRITIQGTGPGLYDALGGAKTSAVLEVDFLGDFPNSTFAASQPQPRLRLGYAKVNWAQTALTVGQDWMILAPLNPTSLAHAAITPLSSSGNLWNRMPQIRVDQNLNFNDSGKMLITAGMLRPVAGDNWTNSGSQQLDISGEGEQTTRPFYQGRIAISMNVMDQPATLGISGHYGDENYTNGATYETSAVAIDLTLPLGMFAITGEAFSGKNLDQFLEIGGAKSQGLTAAPVHEVASKGGWVQFSFTPSAEWNFNAAYGIDHPESGDIASSASINSPTALKNQTYTANVIWKLGPKLSTSIEYNHIVTDFQTLNSGLAVDSGVDNHYNLAFAYYF